MHDISMVKIQRHKIRQLEFIYNKKGSYKAPARDISFITIPGRNGNLIIDNGSYKNIEIPYSLALLSNGERDFATLAHIINEWLLKEAGYYELTDSYDDNYYRLAAYSSEIDIEQELTDTGKLSLKFYCKPFKYLISGKDTIRFTANGFINNPEKYASKPYIKITGSGNISVNINNDTFNFINVDEYIEIDTLLFQTIKKT